MIEFPCRCGRGFSLPDDQAGTSFQCPDCHLLVEVPLLSDLKNIEEDGSYKVGEVEVKPEPERIKELRRIYLAGHTGRDTEQIDLRTSFEDLKKAGVSEVPPDSKDGIIPGAPIYDPVTGELIEPLDIKAEPKKPMAAIPVEEGAPTLNYEKKEMAVITPLKFSGIFADLVRPGSLASVGIILLMHFLVLGMILLVSMMRGLFVPLLLGLPMFMMLVAYWPKLVTEFGPGEADELPGVFRDAEFGSDIWSPFVHLVSALALSYFPLLFVKNYYFAVAWIAMGSFVFPAFLLTTCCSGILADLRPDRIIAVIKVCGANYFLSVALWLATVYGYGYVLLLNLGLFSPVAPKSLLIMISPALLIGAVFVPIFFSIHLASLYRAHFAEFPWVFQDQIIRMKKAERAKRRRSKKLKYVNDSPNSHSATHGR